MPLKTHHDEQPGVNLTPMIDVVFLLIIFFMVGTKFTELERQISLQVPDVRDAHELGPALQRRVVSVHRDGQIALDREPVSLDELTLQLAEARLRSERLAVQIRGDAAGTFQRVAEVMAACKHAGIEEFGISVQLATPR